MKNDYTNSEKTAIAYSKLGREDRRLLEIFDSLLLGVMIIEPLEHLIVYINPEAARMIDRPPGDLLNRFCNGYICPCALGNCPITDLEQHMDRSARYILDRSGREAPIYKSVKRISFNNREHLLETFMDIRDVAEKERLVGVLEMAGAAAHHLSQPLQAIIFELDDLAGEVPAPWNCRVKNMLESIEEIKGVIKNIQEITHYRTREYVRGSRIVDIYGASSLE